LVTLWNNVTVNSVNAGSGLIVDKHDLTITGAGSSINRLQLFSQSRLIVHQTLNLIGPSQVWYELWGPGTVVSSGQVDLSWAKLRDGVVFRNQGDANVTAEDLMLNSVAGVPTFENEGTFTLANNRDVEGSGGIFKNSGQLTYSGPGTEAYFDPKYVQTGGSLNVRGGKLWLRSPEIHLQGGELSIAEDAQLNITNPFGGLYPRRFSGIHQLIGKGVLVLLEPMTVAAPVLLRLGSWSGKSPLNGIGAFVLRSTLTLEADLFNEPGHRMRFWNGKLVGARIEATFHNSGVAFTHSTGNAIFEVNVRNTGFFFLLGPGMKIGNGADFRNYHAFEIVQGDVAQGAGDPGRFTNFGVFSLEASGPNIQAKVSTIFRNADGGTVEVKEGELHLQGTVHNLLDGVLTGGTWRVEEGGLLDFPGAISELKNAAVEWRGNARIPDLASLRLVHGPSYLELKEGANLDLTGALTITEGSTVKVEKDSGVFVSGTLEIGDPSDSVVPELSGIVVLARPAGAQTTGAATPPLVTTPTLDNAYGRVLPTERHRVGTMQLVGDYIQGPDGSLHIDVSPSGGDLLQIDGNATLDGRLELNRLGQVTPGTEFTILTTTGVVTGTFAEIVAPDLYSVSYQAGSVTVIFEEKLSEIFADDFESGTTVWWSHAVQ
jgi:hypothetical protein